MKDKQLFIIKYHGTEHQLKKLAEECAELIQAILKNEDPFQVRIIDEMADVLNLIEQIQLQAEFIREGVNVIKEHKVNREIKRINIDSKEAWKFALD